MDSWVWDGMSKDDEAVRDYVFEWLTGEKFYNDNNDKENDNGL